ncbi:hypothetical protein FS837_009134 [Tulasnella sp. UAMH 9824]|nr:hypothetical protein FS837_009134 [Tulasnella sp. UAMH 9824]
MILLAGCPNLAILRLYDIFLPRQQLDDESRSRTSSALAVVELAALQNLELSNVPARLGQGLLEHLRLPAECRVSVRCHISDSSPSVSFLSTALLHHGIFHRGENTDQATISIADHPRGFRLIVALQRWRMSLRLNGAEAVKDALEWFGISTEDGNTSPHSGNSQMPLVASRNASVMLRLGRYAPNVDLDLLATISGFRCITGTEIDGLCASAQAAFFKYISEPGDSSRPTTSVMDPVPKDAEAKTRTTMAWPFPGLREMVLKNLDADVVNGLVNAIQSRSGDNGSSGGGPEIPARLKRIAVVGGGSKEPERKKGMYLLEGNSNEAERLIMDILDILKDGTEPSSPEKCIFTA